MSDVVEKKRTGINWGLIVRLVVTFGILGYLVFSQDWPKIFQLVRNADPLGLAGAIALSGVVLFLVSLRWWIILRVQEIHLPLQRITGLNLIGQFFNAFLLGSTGGDVIRIYYLIRQVPDRKAIATLSILVDRAFGLLALLLVTAIALPSQLIVLDRDPNTRQIAFSLYLILGLGSVAALVALYAPLHHFPSFLHRLWIKIPKRELLEELFHACRAYGRSLPLSLSALFLACLVHLTNFTAAWLIIRSLGLEVDWISAIVMMAIILTTMALPISISGHGIREAMFILMFTLFGLIGEKAGMRGSEYAVAASFLYFARDLVWSGIGGLVYLTYSHQLKADPSLT